MKDVVVSGEGYRFILVAAEKYKEAMPIEEVRKIGVVLVASQPNSERPIDLAEAIRQESAKQGVALVVIPDGTEPGLTSVTSALDFPATVKFIRTIEYFPEGKVRARDDRPVWAGKKPWWQR